MTTVGYGDFYPATYFGRLIGVFACLWGNLIVSIMVVSLTISAEFTPQQRKAYERITHYLNYQKNADNAARVI